ncbi:MAG: hypothetical protein ACPW61_03350 [Methyloligella sp. ZOD6]
MRQAAPALAFVLLAALSGLTGCGSSGKESAAWKMNEDDPLSRPVQVAWTSARASHCGFIFQPAQLRANYLNRMRQLGTPASQLAEMEEAYDYTYKSVSETIGGQTNYCTKSKTDAIRKDLQQYLAGNFAHRASPAD